MNFTTHPNGQGRIVGIRAAVGSDCLVEKKSEIRGASFVSCLSTITGESIIDNAHVVSAEIDNSMILDSHIAEAEVSRACLNGVVIRGAHGRVAKVSNVILSGGVVVENCEISNVELDGSFLVHSNWSKTPRHRMLRTANGVIQGLIECSEDNDSLHSGCECRPWKMWDQNEHLLRRHFVGELRWPLEAFNSIRTTFEQWRQEAGRT